MSKLIEPRLLSGFRDYPPALMMPREEMLSKARAVYRSYGFAPIDTPALEYAEILLGKGGDETDRLLYRFKDHGDRDVALRFDLTVPFARFAAMQIEKLGTPFKRYHVGPVWRGERAARGRYREFWQCDFDTIGTTDNAADIEVVLVIHDLLRALGIERFTIRINHRLLLNGLLQEMGLADRSRSVLIALDKLPKIGADAVAREMVDNAAAALDQANRVLALAELKGSNDDILNHLAKEFAANAGINEGVTRLRQLLDVTRTAGIASERIKLDLSIARGLDYYTGSIYETFLDDKPDIGSVCSGGRYDNLAELYTKRKLPGVGASLGLDRLLAALEELNLLPKTSTPAPVLIVNFDAAYLGDYQRLARNLRETGIGVEVYPESKKIGQQLQYGSARGFRIALIAGPDEFAQGTWKVRNMESREEKAVPAGEIIAAAKSQMTNPKSQTDSNFQ
jgi:histidyl-tRNA synthetase